ncbi:hypothetical protein MTR67_012843 [Solanum verrucosum]|uniref:Integrase zinc-binding domain-containing protein n=1 Tax=Solanum verrucosum TaxID=315347 RepID=A0AAF0QB68_SOLVR|nr:hypothetical protein MTR67_012843 [Solanum verrucosum]
MMYRDLREVFWWNGMKRDIANFVVKCPNCQQVKVEHQKPRVRVTKSAHFLAVKTTDSGEDYAKPYINEIVWLHGVPLSIISDRGVMRFGKKGKLSPRYVGPYKILKRVGKVAYELELPTELVAVYPIFYISLLKKCVGDPTYIVPLESVVVKDSLTYEDVPVEILDHQVRRLRNEEVASVKVLWRSQYVERAT